MSDTRLRELERRWQESGTDADGAEWLRASVRAGELTDRAVDVLYLLGHPAATSYRVRLEENGGAMVPQNRFWQAITMVRSAEWVIVLSRLIMAAGLEGWGSDSAAIVITIKRRLGVQASALTGADHNPTVNEEDSAWDYFQWVARICIQGPLPAGTDSVGLLGWGRALKIGLDVLGPVLLAGGPAWIKEAP